MISLTLVAASPVYYQAPLYRLLAADPALDFQAIFASSAGLRPFDDDYGRPVQWDVDLTSGYQHTFLRRAEANPIGGGFFTFRDPDIIRLLRQRRSDVLWLHGYNSLT